MTTDFDSHSPTQQTAPVRHPSRRSSARSGKRTWLKDEAVSIYTQFVLYPAVPPSQAFPWFTTVLDGLSEPLSRYHE
jgi:hypothetical protein